MFQGLLQRGPLGFRFNLIEALLNSNYQGTSAMFQLLKSDGRRRTDGGREFFALVNFFDVGARCLWMSEYARYFLRSVFDVILSMLWSFLMAGRPGVLSQEGSISLGVHRQQSLGLQRG